MVGLGTYRIITDRLRSTREGYVLTRVCPSIHPSVCPHLGGYPSQVHPEGVPHLRYPHQTWLGGYPNGGYPDEGYPNGGTPPQVPPLDLGTQGVPQWGVPHLGYPRQTWSGIPQWGYPDGGGGYPTSGSTWRCGRCASCVHAGGLSCYT